MRIRSYLYCMLDCAIQEINIIIKVLYCFYKIILKIRANLKRHNRVCILSSKHTYRPMRARVVAQLFYNHYYKPITVFTVSFSRLHYNVIQSHLDAAISCRNYKIDRNCLTYVLVYVVMQMKKVIREVREIKRVALLANPVEYLVLVSSYFHS